MAGQDGKTPHDLEFAEALAKRPYDFDFFQTIRRLECMNPDKPRLGTAPRPVDEPVRLGQEPALTFAPASLASFKPGDDERPARLAVTFFGMFGPNGPLPLHLTEYARDRARNAADPTFLRFIDVFHHRMLSLFYRAWANAQPAVNFDRPESDRFAIYVGSLFGMAIPSFRNRDAFPDLAKLHYAGPLSCQTKSADGLRAMIEGFFGMPARIEQFVGQWLELPEPFWCRMGQSREVSTLGESVTVGSRTWEAQGKFRVVIGPVDYADYTSLLPGAQSLARLVALVRNYIGQELSWDLNLILRKQDVPALRLGGKERLGWTTWLSGSAPDSDASDLALDPLGAT